MTPPAPGGPGPAPAVPGQRAGGPLPAAVAWRRWRVPIVVVAIVLLGGIAIALLQPKATITGDLDPADTGPAGTHALAAILAARGTTVTRAITPAAARADASAGATLVITAPGLLTSGQLASLASLPGDLVIVAPDRPSLAALTPAVTLAGTSPIGAVPPRCGLQAAALAGPADLGGLRLRVSAPGALGCYPVNGLPSLVQYPAGGRTITVLGTGEPLANASLAQQGNAALALDLLDLRPRVVWLVPGPGLLADARPPGQPASLISLIPRPAYLVAIQLVIAALLVALWRGRRLGPLVPEPLPTIVRAAETVEGHARLYQSRRARDRAASVLRTAAARRLTVLLGQPAGAGPDALVQALASRSGRSAAQIEALLTGPEPADDTALATLAAELDALEREVRAQ